MRHAPRMQSFSVPQNIGSIACSFFQVYQIGKLFMVANSNVTLVHILIKVLPYPPQKQPRIKFAFAAQDFLARRRRMRVVSSAVQNHIRVIGIARLGKR